MISVNNLSLYFGGQDIFSNISFRVNKGDKIGLVGKNGAGKSTLLNLLSKNITPNDGSISTPNGLIFGYLTQDLDFKDGKRQGKGTLSSGKTSSLCVRKRKNSGAIKTNPVKRQKPSEAVSCISRSY